MQGGKVAVGGISIILVVGVAIGLIAGLHGRGGHKSTDGDDEKVLSTTTKAVAAICSPTDYKQQCISSFQTLANNHSATPKDFLMAAIDITMKEVKEAIGKSESIGLAGNSSGRQKMATEDCQDLLQLAIGELQASFSMVGDAAMHTINDRAQDLKNWLSAVISYQQSCIDGFDETPEVKSAIQNGLLNATQLTSNALAIVSEISAILTSFNIPLNFTSSFRRLQEATEESDQYPSWFSAADRKLLGRVDNGKVTPNAVVALDGSGQYKSIGAALAAYPKNLNGRYVIYVKAGIYDEYITIEKNLVNIFMYGDGPRKTMVTGKKSFLDGITTYKTSSFSVIGNGFICKSMGFRNTAGPEGHQAVALRVQSDYSAFFNCRMDGYQDTLYVQAHRQFYRNCVISGTVDFIFGDSTTLIQNSLIIVRKPLDNQQNTITAHGRAEKRETTGLVIQNCRIVPEEKLFPTRFKTPSYLGRPWKAYSRTVVMESTIGDFIHPAGWLPWMGNFALDTLYYAEYANKGPGANTAQRVKWKGYKVITNRNEALQFTAGPFIQGNEWLRLTGAPYFLGFRTM
ncbi:pectinesterase-like [Vitis riparia]|uniref:pectinesterase-like n=1 Tax=Vitis riparia TaxID=96939 RepID=UPI00155AE0FD|nr:pectinesterase-like [Vitis riparia]